jgi:tetratricopeptide (TPR) repeat protein|tara:strand:+ start:587 stop:2104 length:1518 start_codon:yes stop_codon:yes gene_type:complete
MPSFTRLASKFSTIAICAVALFAISGCADSEERISRALNKADQARQKNETSEALSILAKAAMKNPDSAALQESIANTQIEANDPQAAAEAFVHAIELDPNRSRLWVHVAELRIRLSEADLAAAAFENYLDKFPDDFLAWKNYAQLQEERSDFSSAIKATLQWNRIRPSAGPALKLGQLFKDSGNTPQARSWISQAAAYARDPGAENALATLIELEISLQQYLPASTWLDQYDSRYGADNSDPRIQAARDLIGKWRQAQLDIAETAARLEEKRRKLEQFALDAQLQEEKTRAEREALLQAQVVTPLPGPSAELTDNPEGTSNTASQTPKEGLATGERAPIALAETTEPDFTQTPATDYLSSAREAAAIADYTTAIDLYWRALGSASDDPSIWHELARIYMENQNWLDAEACILEAKRRSPRSANIAASYITVISQTQVPARAVQEAEALINLFPQNAAIALALAQTFRKANAPRSRVAQAYENFLGKAESGAEGHNEATRYLSGSR